MICKKSLVVKKEEGDVEYTYYVRETYSSEFNCRMYNVGIKSDCCEREIYDFSPSAEEAENLCDYLYRENVTPENLFLIGEEFIVS